MVFITGQQILHFELFCVLQSEFLLPYVVPPAVLATTPWHVLAMPRQLEIARHVIGVHYRTATLCSAKRSRLFKVTYADPETAPRLDNLLRICNCSDSIWDHQGYIRVILGLYFTRVTLGLYRGISSRLPATPLASVCP